MKVGLSVRIDVSKIDKSRLYKGAKGTYLDLTTFIDTEQKDQYENNGFISQSTTKDERQQGVKTPILGNVRVFHIDGGNHGSNAPQPAASNSGPGYGSYFDDKQIPF